ncbi:MAG: TetR/AcrR family transcriptional regulator [bacterium]|nr:TetR/AcrR family transcriptional regulator [bacterium]
MVQEVENSASSDRHEQRKNQLLDVATRLFAKYGLEGTTTKDIAREAKVSPGLLYHYYTSKEELLTSIIKRFKERSHEWQENSVNYHSLDTRDGLIQLINAFAADIRHNRDILQVIMKAAAVFPSVREVLIKFKKADDSPLVNFLRERINSGELRDVGAVCLAQCLRHIVIMLCLSDFDDDSNLDVPALVDIFLNGATNRNSK